MALEARSAGITPFFKSMAFKDERASIAAGRPIFKDVEVVEVRFAGSKDCGVYLTTDKSHWEVDEETGQQVHITYAERWPRQYQQFQAKKQQTKSGTPLDYVPFLTDAKRAELRALNIYTIEALAELDGQSLKNLGLGGRDMKNKAVDYLATTSHDALVMKQQTQIEALLAQIRVLQEDKQQLASGPPEPPERRDSVPPEPSDDPEEEDDDDGEGQDERTVPPGPNVAAELIGMSRDELRAFIVEKTGKRPVGNPSMRNLVRMAQELGR